MKPADFLKSHQPRCLIGFCARPAALPDLKFDGHPSDSDLELDLPSGVTIQAPEEINTIFALSCTCGSDQHFIRGYRWQNPDYDDEVVFLSPLVLECAACGKQTDLIDTDIHGYDAELGYGSTTARGEGEPAVYECPTCGRQPMQVFTRFEYPDDLMDGSIKEFAGREQNLFTWFSLVVRCSHCAQVLCVADFECA